MASKSSDRHTFALIVSLTEAEFWRFNLYMACEAFDSNDERIDYHQKVDIVANSAPYPTEQPADYSVERIVRLDVAECAWARAVLYLVPFLLPEERSVDRVAPLPMRVAIEQDGRVVASYDIHANPWSGRRLDLELPIDAQYKIRGR